MSVTYKVGIQGLGVSLDPSLIMSEKMFFESDLPSNVNWETVAVASEKDMDRWIEAKNRYLSAAWTPNQDNKERAENARIMRDAEKMMSALEV